MKKYIILVVAIFLTVTFEAFAHAGCAGGGRSWSEDGLMGGLDFSLDHTSSDEAGTPTLKPMVGFGGSFLDGKLDVLAEAFYTAGFPDEDGHAHAHGHAHGSVLRLGRVSRVKETARIFGISHDDHDHNHDHDHDHDHADHDDHDHAHSEHSLYLNFRVGYNRFLSDVSTLSFILQHEFDEIVFSPRDDDANNITGILTPAFRLTRAFDNNDELFAEIGVPISYVHDRRGFDIDRRIFGVNVTLGWESAFGLTIEGTLLSAITPDLTDNNGITGLELLAEYDYGQFTFGLEAIIPRGASGHQGMTITPDIGYNIGHLDIYAYCSLLHVGGGGGMKGIHYTPGLGVRYTLLH